MINMHPYAQQENTKVSFNKDAELQPATFRQTCFPVIFATFLEKALLRTPVQIAYENRWNKCRFLI